MRILLKIRKNDSIFPKNNWGSPRWLFYGMVMLFGVALNISVHATSFYVDSLSGKDSNDGISLSSPWKTLSKANSQAYLPGDSLLLKRGGFWRESLKIISSGLTVGAYGTGALPQLSGTIAVDSSLWQQYSGNIYVAQVGSIVPPTQLYVEDELCDLARYPNTGYLKTTANSPDLYTFINKNLSLTSDQAIGATLLTRRNNWSIDALSVSGYTNGTLTTSNPARAVPMLKNWGFFLRNKLWMLDRPKEWYYDSSSGKLYLWTPNGNSPALSNVRITQIDNVIECIGNSNVTIRDLTVVKANKNNVYMDGGTNLTVENLNLVGGELGLYLRSPNPVVTNNTVTDAIWGGLFVRGINGNITKNKITRVGIAGPPAMRPNPLDYGDGPFGGVGLYVQQAHDGIISDNVVSNTGYIGIRFDGNRSLVKNNTVDHACVWLQDGGGIYVWKSGGRGSIITENTVSHSVGNWEGTPFTTPLTMGIYLDGSTNVSSNITVSRNSIDNDYIGIFIHNGFDNTILNNRVHKSDYGLRIAYDEMGVPPTGRDTTLDNLIFGNLFEADTSVFDISRSSLNVVTSFGTFNNNAYCYSPSGYAVSQIITNNLNVIESFGYNFSDWVQTSGQDAQSIEVSGDCSLVTPPPVNPTVTLTGSPFNGSLSLSWRTFNAVACVASGGWNGKKAIAGTETIESPTNNASFVLECSNEVGSSSQTFTLPLFEITDVAIPIPSITSSSATVTWRTNQSASSQISYGLTSEYGMITSLDPSKDTLHSQGLTNLLDGREYHYNVKSINSYGTLIISDDKLFSTLLIPDATPPSVSLTNPIGGTRLTSLQTVAITATATDNKSVSKVWFLLNGVVVSTDTNAPYSFDWPVTAADNRTYSWTAKAFDAAGNSSTSQGLTVTVDIDGTPPSIPTNLSVTQVSSNSVQLAWTSSTDNVGVSQYVIYRGASSVGTIGPAMTCFTDHNVLPSNAYDYSVSAEDGAGNRSGKSNVLTVLTLPLPLAAPSGTIANVTDRSIGLHWSPVNRATSYTLAASLDDSPGSVVTLSRVTGTGEALSNLTPNTTYYLFLNACDDTHCTDFTPLGPTVTQAAVPKMSVGHAEGERVLLTIDPRGNPEGTLFRIEAREQGGEYIVKGTGSSLFPEVTGLIPGQRYTFRVLAVNLEGVLTVPSNETDILLPTDTVDTVRAYPNPFRPGKGSSGIIFDRLPENTTINIYAIDGHHVTRLMTSSSGEVLWTLTNGEGVNITSGVYIVAIKREGNTKVIKVLIQK